MPNETQRYRKHFIPLESNPEVFTELVHRLGVSGQLCFQDVYSLTDTELLAFLPRPAYALVLVFPAAEAYWEKVELEEEELAAYAGSGPDEETIFFKQTINNACGLYALLHAVCNGEARSKIEKGSILDGLLNASIDSAPDKRAHILEDSDELEKAYAAVARKGDTEAPANAEDEVDYHYKAFVKSSKNGHLYQLDGVRKRPIDHGEMAVDDDVLSRHCLQVIQCLVTAAGDDVHFSLMALVEDVM